MKLKILIFIPLLAVLISFTGANSPGPVPESMQAVPALAEIENADGNGISNIQQDTRQSGADSRQTTESTQPSESIQQPEATQLPSVTEQQEAQQQDSTQQKAKLSFVAVGDIMLGRNVGNKLEKASGGYDYAFGGVRDILGKGDILFANLESPLTSSTHGLDRSGKIVLKGKPEAVEALKAGGFNLVSIANNHMLDYYDTGMFDTMVILSGNGIAFAGGGKDLDDARKPAVIEKNGLKIGLLCYTDMAGIVYKGSPGISFEAGEGKPGLAPREYGMIREDIAKLRGSVDILAVSMHWGVEESFTVTPEQVSFARQLIDDGADVILGHHPHQFQGIEIYKGKPIMYSMGNFLFDQNDPENQESFIVDMEYSGDRLENLTATPVRIVDKSHVEVQTGSDAGGMLGREAGLCSKLGTSAEIDNDILVFALQ